MIWTKSKIPVGSQVENFEAKVSLNNKDVRVLVQEVQSKIWQVCARNQYRHVIWKFEGQLHTLALAFAVAKRWFDDQVGLNPLPVESRWQVKKPKVNGTRTCITVLKNIGPESALIRTDDGQENVVKCRSVRVSYTMLASTAKRPERHPVVIGQYQHYKGDFYTVVNFVTHSETLEKLVVYGHDGVEGWWARPESMFHDIVEWPDGSMKPRFIRC